MTKPKVGINGFGRIGRVFTRIAIETGACDVVAINDLASIETMAHLLKYDSVHRQFNGEISIENGNLILNGKEIKVSSEPDPNKLDWKGVDIVLEASGKFRKESDARKHLRAGAKKVLLSAPPKDGDIKQFVLGINEDQFTGDEEVFSNASCTTNSCAHIVKYIDEKWGIENGFLTTIHAYTSDQRLQDAPHSDLRRARAAANSIIPTTTGAAKAVINLFPHLEGKFLGNAARVPVPDGSYTDLTLLLNKPTSVDEINTYFNNLTNNQLKGIVLYNEDPIVSCDIIGNSHSGVFDSTLTESFGNLVKVISWYDNEFGYSSRLVDLVNYYYSKHMA